MKIVNIVPGFGGTFYCGNCLRDSAYVRSLRDAGHQAITLPLYMPLSSVDFTDEREQPVFYGAVNLYLKQNYRVFRKMPGWLYRFFDSNAILRYASKKSGSTRAKGLEAMTISMLQGEEGFQKDELDMLIDYLKHHEQPDVVHLSNALLLGLAGKIKRELKIPVICSLQDEDVWVDAMDEPFKTQVWNLMALKGNDIAAFIAVSDFFAQKMKLRMNIPNEKLFVVHIGIDHLKYRFLEPNLITPTIGFLSRRNKSNGFEILIDAFIKLKQNPQFSNARLRVTGGKTDDDNKFINNQLKKLEKNGYLDDIEFVEDFRTEVLPNFFSGLTLLSVPVIEGEAFGLYQLESLASGIPIVQPAVGAFPEVVEASKGGVVFSPNTPDSLANKLIEVLSDQELLKTLSANGRKATETDFNSKTLIKKMIEIYRSVLSNQ